MTGVKLPWYRSNWAWERTMADVLAEIPRPIDTTPHEHFHSHGGTRHAHSHVHPESHAHSSLTRLPAHTEESSA